MRSPRFFVKHPLAAGEALQLPQSVSHHMLHVLRMKTGDQATLFNGSGSEFPVTITHIKRSNVSVSVDEPEYISRESSLNTILALAVLKSNAMDAALTRATELGVSEIVPIMTDRCSKPRARDEHWQEVIQSSCEQCGRNQLPLLSSMRSFDDWLASAPQGLRLLANPLAAGSLKDIASTPSTVSIMIGPEGGLASSEVEAAEHVGFTSIAVGHRILRAETAPAALLALVQYRWGDFT
ncbi:MAG: 16S rRNA (uracil(1498)-N(3))-methyltransferase [Pseudomonadales bacterium]|nr:16S rRNA (uracil(1498)-N(3))-methyltransferase [Pseudomonadales bacterium]